jgi:uncharacterized membrane protein (UPF0182 family)
VFVDAYDGSVEFFALNEQDPILDTYRKSFLACSSFRGYHASNYRQHLRYPHDFFTAQAQMYRAYHMENPEVFYNREDLWRFPERSAMAWPPACSRTTSSCGCPTLMGQSLFKFCPSPRQ